MDYPLIIHIWIHSLSTTQLEIAHINTLGLGHPRGDCRGGLPQRQVGPRLVHGATSALGRAQREGHPGEMLGMILDDGGESAWNMLGKMMDNCAISMVS